MMVVYFYKLIYFFRKKTEGFIIGYLRKELKVLNPGRIEWPESVTFEIFPIVYLDRSHSKILLAEDVAVRGMISFLSYNNAEICIGRNTFFNRNCSINAMVRVQIGDDCLFGENVKIYDHNHQYRNRPDLIKNQGFTAGEVVIGSNCWIGSDVIILKGAKIGNNCIVGARSLVNKEIPDNSIVIQSGSGLVIKPY
jgi:acetyltransferase-like isoleucine patch superfamily enzyme